MNLSPDTDRAVDEVVMWAKATGAPGFFRPNEENLRWSRERLEKHIAELVAKAYDRGREAERGAVQQELSLSGTCPVCGYAPRGESR